MSKERNVNMKVSQIHALMNTVTQEVLGKENLVAEDLSNVVDVGNEVFNAEAVDNYVKSLVNHIGKVIFVNRPYTGIAPSVMMDGWEYGSVLEKISVTRLPEATENESWELTNGTSYDPNIFYKPEVSAKFFNKRVTFEVPMSFTERQVKESFSNAEQLNGFISMIYTAIDKSMTVKMDSLIMRTIDSMIGETLHADYADGEYTTKSGVKAVNLLKLFNDKFNTNLTQANALTNPEFIRFASFIMNLYKRRLAGISTLYNIGGTDKFTSPDKLHVVYLAEFSSAAGVYLYDANGQFKDENIKLPEAEVVPYWQASGKSFDFGDTSKINVTTGSGATVTATGILGIMFDRDALGVANLDKRVTSNYNPKGEFYSNWYKFDAGYYNDLNENFVVFFIA
jgi:hypothetical protein